jgi:hypothetical protein
MGWERRAIQVFNGENPIFGKTCPVNGSIAAHEVPRQVAPGGVSKQPLSLTRKENR